MKTPNESHLPSFQQAYRDAKAICLDIEGAAEHSPHNPVIRFDGTAWRLESGLLSAADTVFEAELDAFDSFFHEAYGDDSYVPNFEHMLGFVGSSVE